MKEISGVHVISPGPFWQTREWLVATDDGGLFCSCYFGTMADGPGGGEARERAEFIAKAVNAYIRASAHSGDGR